MTGSFEINTNVYLKDAKTLATVPDGRFGSNNYLKVDYYNKRFSAGVQLEAKGSVTTNVTGDYLLNTTGRSPQWNFCIPLSELQTNLAISSDQNNPDPTSFTGDPQRTL